MIAAIATIGSVKVKGETSFHAIISLNGRTVYRVRDYPTLQAVRIDVLDWARRLGKELEWEGIDKELPT